MYQNGLQQFQITGRAIFLLKVKCVSKYPFKLAWVQTFKFAHSTGLTVSSSLFPVCLFIITVQQNARKTTTWTRELIVMGMTADFVLTWWILSQIWEICLEQVNCGKNHPHWPSLLQIVTCLLALITNPHDWMPNFTHLNDRLKVIQLNSDVKPCQSNVIYCNEL